MKKFLIAGLASMVSAASLYAADVTSINAVGYANVTIPTGFSMVANPLSATSTKARDLFASVPANTVFFKFTGAGFDSMTKLADNFWRANPATGGSFFNDATKEFSLAPGEGVFVNNSSGSAVAVTFVGEVLTGNLSNPIPAGFSIRSSQVPQAGALQNLLGFPAVNNDTVYTFDPSSGYTSYTLLAANFWRKTPPTGSSTFGAQFEPSVGVGQAFWVLKGASATWARTFTIN